MLVHFTAPTLHAYWQGRITLEIINLGSLPIILYPHAAICQLIIESVKGSPIAKFKEDEQFFGQNAPKCTLKTI